MARGIRIPILGDADSILRAINKTIGASERLGVEMKTVGVKAQQSARLQIEASVKKDARLRNEIAVYRQIAAAAARGSREQIVAANLANQAEHRLSRSLGVTAHESSVLAASHRRAERELGRVTRGALAGSGVFRGLGRSLAFASGGFLAFASAGQLIRSSIDAATQALATQRQLGAQFRASGVDLNVYRKQIEETASATSALSGFTRDELIQAFTTAFRGSKNVAVSLKEEAIAADVARGRHLGLSQSVIALAKAYGGQVTALRRLGIQVPTNLKGMAALNFVAAKFAGQAQAGTTAQQRFGAELHNTEETIGKALLPSLNKYLASGSRWLSDSENQARIQKDVAEGARLVGKSVSGIADAFKIAKTVLSPFVGLMGGVERTAEALGLAFIVLKTRALLAGLGLRAAGTGAVVAGGEMAAATVEVGILSKSLLALEALSPIGITIVIDRLVHEKGSPFGGFNDETKKLFHDIGQVARGKPGAGLAAVKDIGSVLGTHHDQPALGPGQSPIGENAFPAPRDAKTSSDRLRNRLGLLARFAKADLALAKAERTKITSDDRAALEQEALIVEDEIASRKKVFRDKTGLERQLGGIEQQEAAIDKAAADARKQRTQQRRADFLQGLQLNIDRAGLTKGLGDDVKAAEAQVKGLTDLLARDKHSLDLQQQLVGAESQLADLRRQQREQAQTARDTRQFRALGLGPGGSVLAPTQAALKKELGNVSDTLKGTFLDTNAHRTLLRNIRRLLSGQLGALSADVRSQVKALLDDLKSQFAEFDGFNLTKAEKRRRSLDKALTGPVGSNSRSSRSRSDGKTVVVNQTIVAAPGESADSLARRQHFRARQAFAH